MPIRRNDDEAEGAEGLDALRRRWDGLERRRYASDAFRKGVVDGIEDFWQDKDRVRNAVHVLFEAMQEEMSSGAGKAVFHGVRRVVWILLIAFLVLGLGGWQPFFLFLKSAFGSPAGP